MSKELADQLSRLVDSGIGKKETLQKFSERIKNIRLTRDEGELTHVGVFVMAIDVKTKMIYLGHHRKSNRWIPHGGHVDAGEAIEQTFERETFEEWGRRMKANETDPPALLTITKIENPKQWNVCKIHYDVWYFVKVDKETFLIPNEILLDEFNSGGWFDMKKSRELVGNTPSVVEALDYVEQVLLN